jgi:TolB-like protein
MTKPKSSKISLVTSPETDPDPKDTRTQTESTLPTPTAQRSDEIATPEPAAIRLELARILQSGTFVRSERLRRFLRFIVEHVVAGNQDYIKEYVIGCEVYDRRPPYHPTQDSIVRTEARRLRGKLQQYYEKEGKHDPVHIHLCPGSYVPALRFKETLVGAQSAMATGENSGGKISATTIAILPFRDITGSTLSSTYARGIPDELAYALMRTERCKVISPSSMAHLSAHEHDVTTVMSKAGAQIAYEGSVREEDNHIRVTATIIDVAGFQLWTKRFDADLGSQTLFALEEQIASALSTGLNCLFRHFQPVSSE